MSGLSFHSVIAAVGLAAASALADTPDGAAALGRRAVSECMRGRDARERSARETHFQNGQELAERAIALDDSGVDGHFGLFCNMGELMRLDGESITDVLALRRLMAEIDRTLELAPEHPEALATKGTLLLRLPRLFGGNPAAGEAMLRHVMQLDPKALSSRILVAKACAGRGEGDEARALARRALEIAREQGRADKIAEAQAVLDELGSGR